VLFTPPEELAQMEGTILLDVTYVALQLDAVLHGEVEIVGMAAPGCGIGILAVAVDGEVDLGRRR
jgi:hypothetical protein